MRAPLLLPAILLGLALLPAFPEPADAHVPPPLTIVMDLDEEALRVQLSFSDQLFRDWVTSLLSDKPTVVESGPLLRRVEQFLAGAMSVEADGLVVHPVVRKLASREVPSHDGVYRNVDVTAVYGMKGRLRSLGVAWTKYDDSTGFAVSPIDTELTAYGRVDYPVFTEKEPGYVWHAPVAPRAESHDLPPPPAEPAGISVPWVSAGLVLLLLLLLPVLLLRRVRWPATLAILSAGLVAAFLLRGFAQTEVRPPWAQGFEMPAEADAARLFESLHRNIYRAFDYDTEDAVYETLAQSVDGDLLDEVYVEVYRSLILEDQGGAVCKIQKTEILENEVEMPAEDDARAFHVVCRWRVRGKVGHWGHTHIRVNEYRARYRVHYLGGAWRIAAVDILEQKRVGR